MDRWILFYYVNLRRNNLSNRKEDEELLLLLLLRTRRRNGRSFLFLRGCLWIPTLWGVQSICAIVRGEVDPTALLFAAQSVSPSLSVHSRMDPFNLSASINSFHGRRYQYLRNVLLLHHRIIHPSRKGAATVDCCRVPSLGDFFLWNQVDENCTRLTPPTPIVIHRYCKIMSCIVLVHGRRSLCNGPFYKGPQKRTTNNRHTNRIVFQFNCNWRRNNIILKFSYAFPWQRDWYFHENKTIHKQIRCGAFILIRCVWKCPLPSRWAFIAL